MELNRDFIIQKIDELLEGRSDRNTIYRWALGVAVAEDFAQVCKKDPVAAQVVQALIDINHNDVQSIPTLKALAYYRLCLKGEREYRPLGKLTNLDDIQSVGIEEDEGRLDVIEESVKTFVNRFSRGLRILTLVFGSIVLVVSVIFVMVVAAPGRPDRIKTAFKTFVFILYGVFVILPPSLITQDRLFFLAVPILLFGMIVSWYYSFNMIPGMFSGIIVQVFLSAIIIIPATVAFILLFRAKGFKLRGKQIDS